MTKKTSIIAFITAFDKKPHRVVKLLSNQSTPPDKIVVVAAYDKACIKGIDCFVDPPDMNLSVGERVGKALTKAFTKYDISKYNYVLKLDDDVILPRDFIKIHIDSGLDIIGKGQALLIRTEALLRCLGKLWPPIAADDAYLRLLLLACGYRGRRLEWLTPVYVEPVKLSLKRSFEIGRDYYRMGLLYINVLYEALKHIINGEVKAALGKISGYIYCLVTDCPGYKYRNTIRKYIINRLKLKFKKIVNKNIQLFNLF